MAAPAPRAGPAPLMTGTPAPRSAAGARRLALGAAVAAWLALLATSLFGLAAPVGAGEAGTQLAELVLRGGQGVRAAVDPFGVLLSLAVRFGGVELGSRAVALGFALLAAVALTLVLWRGWGPAAAAAGPWLFLLTPRLAAFTAVPDREMAALAAGLMALASYLRYREQQDRASALATIAWTALGIPFGVGAAAVGLVIAIHAGGGGVLRMRRLVTRAARGPLPVKSPLVAVMTRRMGRGMSSFAGTLAMVVVGESVVVRLVLPGVSGGGALVAALSLPMLVVLAAWLASFAFRAVRRRLQVNDVVPLALALATVAPLAPGLASERSWLTAGAALFATAAVAVAGFLPSVARRAGRPLAVLAVAVCTVALAPVWPGQVRAGRSSGTLAGATPPAALEPVAMAMAHLVDRWAEPQDRLLVRDGFSSSPVLRLLLGHRAEQVSDIAQAAERRVQDTRLVLLFRAPLPGPEMRVLRDLLTRHPATRLSDGEDAVWALDLREYDVGIASYVVEPGPDQPEPGWSWRQFLTYPGRREVKLRRDSWDELRLVQAFGVVPSFEHLPAVPLAEASDQARLIAYHNLLVIRGEVHERRRVRARLLAGYERPRTWVDPAPFGGIAGARYDGKQRKVRVVWECTAAKPAASDFGLRLAAWPVDRGGRAQTSDHSTPEACRGALPGELREESYPLRLPGRGAYAVALEVTRPRNRARRTPTGHAVVLFETRG